VRGSKVQQYDHPQARSLADMRGSPSAYLKPDAGIIIRRTSLIEARRGMIRILPAGLIAIAMLFSHLVGPAHGQTPPSAPSPSSERATQPKAHATRWGKTDSVPSLVVMNAREASLGGGTLVLKGISASAIVFADRPVRAAGHLLTRQVLAEWAHNGSFAKDPPNATISVISRGATSVHDIVVELRNPIASADRLSFDVRVLEGDLAGANGPAAVFIDAVDLWTTSMTMLRPLE
jgi:hypothetical protein